MTRTENHGTILVVAVVAVLAIGYFLLAPLMTDYRAHRLDRAARRTEIENLKTQKATLDRLKSELATNAAEVVRLSLAVPAEENPADLVAQVAALVAESGLTLTTLQPAQGGSETSETVMTVTVSGTYPSLITLTENLEKNLRPAKVRSLNLVESRSEEAAGVLSATLEIAFSRVGGSQ